jgi:cation:H+ antiporter
VSTLRACSKTGHALVGPPTGGDLGTILGSNIFNGLFIVAVAACIHPIAIAWREVFSALVFGVIALGCSYPNGGGFIERRRGVLLLVLYGVYLVTVLQAGS